MVEQLLRYKGQQVVLEFEDGEIIEVLLIGVDPVEHHDIEYDVIAVRKAISDETYPRSKIYVAPIATIKAISTLELS